MKSVFFLAYIFSFALNSTEDEDCNNWNSQKDEILQELKSIENILQSQTSHFCKNVSIPENCLKSSKNLADVGNKAEALKNLQIEGNFERFYTSSIDLIGLSIFKFYPVWWTFPDRIGGNSINIFRFYSENSNLNPFGDTDVHVAGLNLQLEGNSNRWGGGAKYMKIKILSQTYRKTVKNIKHWMLTIARRVDSLPIFNNFKDGEHVGCSNKSGLFLRGGLTYHVKANFPLSDFGYSKSDEETKIDEIIGRKDDGIRWMAKSYAENDGLLGAHYEDVGISYL